MRGRSTHPMVRSLLAAALVLAIVPVPAFATTVWEPEVSAGSFRVDPLGHVGSGYPQQMSVDGTTVYVASITGFSVIDASDPAHPAGIGDYVTPYTGNDVEARDGLLYFASGPRLLVFDVGDPASPALISSVTVTPDDTVREIALVGDTVYALANDSGLKVVDVADETDPHVVASLPIDNASRVSVESTRAYVFAYGSGIATGTLTVLDTTDPSAPESRGACEVRGATYAMAAAGSMLYIPCASGFSVVDVHDPDAPFVANQVEPLDSGNDVLAAATDGDVVFMTDASFGWSRGLHAYDISTPAAPAKIDAYTDLFQPLQLAVSGSRAYAVESGGLAVLDVSDPADLRLLGRYQPGWAGRTVRTAGSIAYYADWLTGLVVADITDPTAPTVTGRLPRQTGWGATSLDVAGNRAYLGGTRMDLESGVPTYSLDVADVSVPTAPVALGSVPSTAGVMSVAFSGGYAFAACDEAEGFRVADVSDPATPEWVASLDIGWAADITVSGDRAYVTASKVRYGKRNLFVIDVSDPDAPVLVDEYDPPSPHWGESWVGGAYESGGRLYVSVYGYGLVTLDATTLLEVSFNPFAFGAGRVYAEGQTLYVCGETLQLYDLSVPDEPVMKGFIYAFGQLGDVRPAVGQTFATLGPGLFTGRWTPTPCAFERISGTDRFGTAAAVSARFWSDWPSDTVVLATGRNFPDALAGAPLAYILGAPLLLCDKSSIPASVTAEIRRLGATHAIVLGSESVVDANVVAQLQDIFETTSPDAVERIFGPDRFATAAAIAERVIDAWGPDAAHTAFVATGRNYPDALSAAGLAATMGYPILLTETASVPEATAEALESLDITRTIVLGSDKAVSDTVFAQVHGARRLEGGTRYDTSRAIAEFGIGEAWKERSAGLWPLSLYLATGANFPDALAAGASTGWSRAPLLLVRDPLDTDAALAPTRGWLAKHKLSIGRVFIIGGPPAVPETVVDDTRVLLQLDD